MLKLLFPSKNVRMTSVKCRSATGFSVEDTVHYMAVKYWTKHLI